MNRFDISGPALLSGHLHLASLRPVGQNGRCLAIDHFSSCREIPDCLVTDAFPRASTVLQLDSGVREEGKPFFRTSGRFDAVHGTGKQSNQAAFTIIELMIAVSLMAIIVIALYGMFNQTQKALRGNIEQVDVLESGRAAMEMMSRELEELSASRSLLNPNLSCGLIFRGAEDLSGKMIRARFRPPPTTQVDINSPAQNRQVIRTNVLQEHFFLSSFTNNWTAIGYTVVGASNGVGSLVRWTARTNSIGLNSLRLLQAFTDSPARNLQRVADGVVHLRLRAFDPLGRLVQFGRPTSYDNLAGFVVRNDVASERPRVNVTGFEFSRDVLPAYLELELGVLEPETLLRYNVLQQSPGGVATKYLAERANKVHIFRQRIPIRTAFK